jgi:hypothetical protein
MRFSGTGLNADVKCCVGKDLKAGCETNARPGVLEPRPAMSFITPVDVARAAGVDPETVRRYLRRRYPKPYPGVWQRFDASQLPELVEWCRSQQQRHRNNRFNSSPSEN